MPRTERPGNGWWLLPAAACLQWGLLRLYEAKSGTWLNLQGFLSSFRLEPISGGFELKSFLGVWLLAAASLAAWAAWLLAAWASGAALLRLLRWRGEDAAEEALVSVGLGLGLLSLLTAGLGMAGLLTRPAMLCAALLMAACGLARPRALPPLPRPEGLGALLDPERLPLAALLLVVSGTAAFHLLGSLLPPGNFDELSYQLALPKLYVLNRGLVSTPYHHHSFLPRNMSMLFAAGLLTGSAAVSKLFSFGMGALAAAAVYVFSRRPLGRAAALCGACLFVSIPVVGNQFRTAGADLGTAFYELLGVFLLLRWAETGSPERKHGSLNTLAVGSVFWGLALGCKYTAVPGFLAAAALVGWRLRRPDTGWRERLLCAAAFAVPALLVWSPWLIQNWRLSGNPVNPLLSTLIPSRNFFFAGEYKPMVDYSTGLGIEDYFPIRNPLDLALLPWRLFTRHNDFNHDLGPALLLCIPLVPLLGPRPAEPRAQAFPLSAGPGYPAGGGGWTRRLSGLCFLYWGFWLAAKVHMTRHFVTGLALTSLLAAPSAARLLQAGMAGPSWVRGAARCLLAIPLLLALAQQSLRMAWVQNVVKKPWGYLSGRCGLPDYVSALQKHYPARAYELINSGLSPKATVLLFNEYRTFYLEKNFIAGTPYDHDPWHELVRTSRDSRELAGKLRGLGVTHFLANTSYVLHQTGRERLSEWTPEDMEKERRFARDRLRVILRTEDAWLAEVS